MVGKSEAVVLFIMHFFLGLNAQEIEWVVYTTSNSELPNNQISLEILVDKDNHKWIPTWGGGVAKFDGENWTVLNTQNSGLIEDYIGHIQIDSMNNFWFSVSINGLLFYNSADDEWIHYNWSNGDIPQNHIRDIFIDNIGRVWIGFAGRGILIIDEEDWTFMDTSNTYIPSGHIRNIIQDKYDESMWITSQDGLMRFDGNNWQVWDIDNSDIPQNFTRGIHQVHTGELWVGTWAEGICLFDGENWTVYNTSNSPLPSNHIRAVTQDHHGDIWIGTDNGVAVIKGLYDPVPQEDPEPEPKPEKELLVYPNPTQNELFIEFPDSTWLNSKLHIYNMQGQLIHQKNTSTLEPILFLGAYSGGVYSIEFRKPDGMLVRRKVVVQ